MNTRQVSTDTELAAPFICSAVIHLAVFLLVIWWSGRAPAEIHLQETYYVDVVNLPATAPRNGSPIQQGNISEQTLPPPSQTQPPMALPAPQKRAPQVKSLKTAPPTSQNSKRVEESSTFAERMAALENRAEARHEEATLAQLRKKSASSGSGRAGMPDGSGTEKGSDYTAYIQSRLADAFRDTISYSSKNPEMVIRLVIDTDGTLSRRKVERSSSDRTFEISVLRAIEQASEKFTPPPNHKVFEGVFVFRPQGISRNKP